MNLRDIKNLGTYAYIRTTDGKEFRSGDIFNMAGATWTVGAMTKQYLDDDTMVYSVICDSDIEHRPWCLEFTIKPECVSILAEIEMVY